ncbi:Arm DNA-binding domain-containing protein [Orbus wheelerorum]|uniref:Arm DNA-binding domain-containing protein n=1 Tax=Orbus wheelerorum TaxID=3074111 RepID=UPI00370D10FD
MDTNLKSLKPKDKLYKVTDRAGLYVAVLTSVTISFRYDYRINERRETLAIGKYSQITLAEA